jgi:hypothetical protein
MEMNMYKLKNYHELKFNNIVLFNVCNVPKGGMY